MNKHIAFISFFCLSISPLCSMEISQAPAEVREQMEKLLMGDVKQIIDKKKDPNLIVNTEYRHTILHAAATWGFLPAVTLLIEAGADVNRQNRQGSTPLMDAVSNGNIDIVRILLEHGANPELDDGDETSAMSIAILHNKTEIQKLLKEYAELGLYKHKKERIL